jgi:hypothetical protein
VIQESDLIMMKEAIIVGLCLMVVYPAMAAHYTMEIGSKSNPHAHLFSYDQKFEESTDLKNYMMDVSASKQFTDATRLSTTMSLKANKNLTEIDINADFIGIGRIGYLVLNPETGNPKDELSRINHMYVGNFSLDEHFLVIKDHLSEAGFLPCV